MDRRCALAIQTVAVIGVGLMGAGVARNIIKGGYDVAIFDLDRDAMARLERDGARCRLVGEAWWWPPRE